MIKIDIEMPNECTSCPFQMFAFDSDLFEDGECFCCIRNESVESNVKDNSKPEWCPLIECECGGIK